MDIKRALPRPELQSVVRSFEERRADLGSAVLARPVAARPHQILDIHLAEPYQVRLDGGPPRASPETVVVGPQTYRRAHIHLSGRVHVFNILFQPTGLNRLVGNQHGVAGQSRPGSFGRFSANQPWLLATPCALRRTSTCASPPSERWVGMMLDKRGTDGSIDHASRLMIAVQGRMRIEYLVTSSGLSASQFQRRFAAQVGMTPKLFARTIRFDRALVARSQRPKPALDRHYPRTWLLRSGSFYP